MKSKIGAKPKEINPEDWNLMQKELTKFSSGVTPQQIQNARPDQLGNSQEMELDWAEKAFKHAEVYFKLITSIDDLSTLKLTKIDSKVYSHFRREFPDLNVSRLDDATLKSPEAKLKWRSFCNSYNGDSIKDYNFGSLLRLDASQDYSEENSTIVPRIQFLAIEIARNVEGHNAAVRGSSASSAAASPSPSVAAIAAESDAKPEEKA